MTFSIITPSLNQSAWLKLCIASVADQMRQVEHIVQDAGSNDGSLDWLQSDNRIRLFVEKDEGMYDAINRGMRRAQGDLLAYLNCDEQYLAGALDKVAVYFEEHPQVDVLFGNVIMVDSGGNYLWHRKVQKPLLFHTWTCHLSTLSCGMFFRRRLIESGRFFFNTEYRCGGDGEWMVRLLRSGIQMGSLGQFTSVFAQTGGNLGRTARASDEWRKLRRTAPLWARALSPFWVMQHRLARWRAGTYAQDPFNYSIYTPENPLVRTIRNVQIPRFRSRQ